MKRTEIQELLTQNGYPYEARIVPSSMDFYRSKGFQPRKETGPFWLLSIPNPNHDKNIEIIFADASEDPEFYDLEFGGYWYEMFGFRDENLPEDLLEEIRWIVSGQTHVIFAMDAKTGKWFSDQVFFDLPEEELNDMDQYHRILARIHAPKSLWRKIIGRTDVYEIFNWNSYRRIIK